MGVGPADFRVEIIKARPQTAVSPTLGAPPIGDVLDVTSRVLRGGLGSINRAMERDLLSFKTGDVTLSLQNRDGYFDDLFAFFGPTDMWGLRIYRRGDVQFYGVLIAVGSIIFDRKVKTLSLTAYGLTKLLDMTDASTVKRTIAATTVTTANAGATTVTIGSTTGLLSGDVLHLTDNVNSEDITIKRVTSATVCSLEVALVNTYAAGSAVTCQTPYYRFKSIVSLVTSLFSEAGIGLIDLNISSSQFNRLAPTPVNLNGLTLANDARRGMTETVATIGGLGRIMIGVHGVDDYTQGDPSSDWITQGLPDKGPYDWSPYYVQGNAGPAFLLFEPVDGTTQESSPGANFATYWCAVDYLSATKRIWGLDLGTVPGQFRERTTVDGVSYTVTTGVVLPATTTYDGRPVGLDYDPVRNFCYVSWGATGARQFRYRDLGGATWVDVKPAGDPGNTGYYGPRYVADLDLILALKETTNTPTGPKFTISAFRGTTLLWERPFPSCLIAPDNPGFGAYFYPTRTARFVNGRIYMTLVSDGAVQLLSTGDNFQTYTMKKLAPSTTKTILMGARVRDTYRIFSYRGTSPKGYYLAAPFYAGVVEYADFNGLSVAEALKKLSILTNSLFWVDDDAQGHFVARDLYDIGSVFDGSRIMTDQTDSILWDQSAQYAAVSGSGVNTTSGTPAFAAQGIELESSFIPNEAFCQALSDSYFAFFSPQRKFVQGGAHDIDGHIFRPLDRLTLGSTERYLVYESDHSLPDDSIALQLLEDK